MKNLPKGSGTNARKPCVRQSTQDHSGSATLLPLPVATRRNAMPAEGCDPKLCYPRPVTGDRGNATHYTLQPPSGCGGPAGAVEGSYRVVALPRSNRGPGSTRQKGIPGGWCDQKKCTPSSNLSTVALPRYPRSQRDYGPRTIQCPLDATSDNPLRGGTAP